MAKVRRVKEWEWKRALDGLRTEAVLKTTCHDRSSIRKMTREVLEEQGTAFLHEGLTSGRVKLEDVPEGVKGIAKDGSGEAKVNGWGFIFSHYFAGGEEHWHLSAMLVPHGRCSTDEDWRFLGVALGYMGVPDPEKSCLTPLETTNPSRPHHWHWMGDGTTKEKG